MQWIIYAGIVCHSFGWVIESKTYAMFVPVALALSERLTSRSLRSYMSPLSGLYVTRPICLQNIISRLSATQRMYIKCFQKLHVSQNQVDQQLSLLETPVLRVYLFKLPLE